MSRIFCVDQHLGHKIIKPCSRLGTVRG